MERLKEILALLPAELEKDLEFKSLAEWFTGKWLFEIGDERYTLHLQRGSRIEIEPGVNIAGYDFALTGPKDEWQKLLKSEIKLAQGLNYYYGRLSLRGNFIIAANSMRLLACIIMKMQDLTLKIGGLYGNHRK